MSRAAKYTAAVVLAAVALLILLVLPPAPHRVTLSGPIDPLVVKGAVHIHTVRSDGGGTIDDVAAAAAAAGLSFVITTDHGDGRVIETPAYRNGVLCLDGAEISTAEGHVVAIGATPAEYPLGGEARDVIEDIHRLGGMAVVAHPGSLKPDLAWKAWDAPFDGVEWLNADSEWRDERSWDLARLALGYWLRPAAAVAQTFDRPASVFARVDAEGARRPIVLLAGHDAHARIGQGIEDRGEPGRGLPLPSYRRVFETFALRVFLGAPLGGNAADDAAIVLRALRHGRVFTAIDGLAAPVRFLFTIRSGRASAGIGERLIPAGPLRLEVEADAPAGATIAVLLNGREIASGPAPRLRAEVPSLPGAYRAEVRLADAPGVPMVPWIVASPIHVGLPAVPALPPVRSGNVLRELTLPREAAAWSVEHSDESSGIVEASVMDGSLQFTFGLGRNRARSPYSALVRPVQVDAAGAIDLRITADRPMRLSLQLRSPEGGGDGLRWQRSLYVDTQERTVQIPLSDFHPIRPARGPVRIRDIDSLLLVVDTLNSDSGSRGTLSLASVRLLY